MLFGSYGNSNSGIKKNATFSERANMALASLKRNSYAMGMLRSKLESKISQAIASQRPGQDSQELTKMLELIKGGELLLDELSTKVESARILEEFIVILDSAAMSVSEITGDMEKMVPTAERALQEMHDAIIKTTMGGPSSQEQESERQHIMEEAATASISERLPEMPPGLAKTAANVIKDAQTASSSASDCKNPNERQEEQPLPA